MSAQLGIRREHQVRDMLLALDWWVIRAAGSKGDADLVAMQAGKPTLFIEVKSTAHSPFNNYPPAKRRAMVAAAKRAGAQAWLVWWPPRGKPLWIASNQWPGNGTRTGAGQSSAPYANGQLPGQLDLLTEVAA